LSLIAFGWFANRIQLLAVISYTGVLRFTVSFDAQHHASVKEIGKTKTEVDEKMKKRFVQLRLPARVARRINWRVRPDNWQLLVRSAWLVAVAIGLMSFQASGADWPEHLTLHEESRSPDGHYGIVVTTSSHVDDGATVLLAEEGEEFVDYFADLQTHRLLGKIKGFEYVEHENHAHLDAQWTPDSKVCVATSWERYGFASAVVLQPKGDSFIQTDIGQRIRKAIDAMIKKQSRDVDADVYPQFYIEPGPKIRVYAEASNNPKQLEDTKTYYALFQGTFDPISKKWTASSARAITAKEDELLQSASEASCCFETYAVSPDPFKEYPDAEEPFAYEEKSFFRSDESKFKYLDERMNDVYKAVHFLLSPAQFQKVKQEQIAWLKKRDATKPLAEKSELTQQRIKVLQELAWPGKKERKEKQ
jgi:uncharacterized protein YecT (DUF1311 family)